MRKLLILVLTGFYLSSCVTGGFDNNEQLDDLNAGLAKTPKVQKVTVNGTEVIRDTQSRRIVNAKVNDVLEFAVDLSSGSGAQLEELEFARVYYYGEEFEEDPKPVEAGSNGFYDVTGKTDSFSFSYTVPEEDDDGFHFDPGYIIQVFFRVKNSLGNYGYRAIEIHIVE